MSAIWKLTDEQNSHVNGCKRSFATWCKNIDGIKFKFYQPHENCCYGDPITT